jgi:hypothetical protein
MKYLQGIKDNKEAYKAKATDTQKAAFDRVDQNLASVKEFQAKVGTVHSQYKIICLILGGPQHDQI